MNWKGAFVWVLFLGLAFTPAVASAKEKPKAGETTLAIPPPTEVKLSNTINVASLGGCPMTAWVHDRQSSNPGYPVKFFTGSTSGTLWKTVTSNSKGEVNLIIPWSTKIVATVQSQTLLTSNIFTCGENPRTSKE